MAPASGVAERRAGGRRAGAGSSRIAESQRARLLDATVAVVGEQGYRRMTARRVSGWAGVSSKTFYDLFSDREDCFLAAFNYAIDQLSSAVLAGWEGEREWTARVRAGLSALLGFLDGEPAVCRLVFVEALGAGPRVLARRAQVLEVLAGAVDEGREGARVGGELPPLTGEGIVGAAFGVIYARLIGSDREPLVGLLNPLMGPIVLPYRGHAVAARELARLTPPVPQGSEVRGGRSLAPAQHAGPTSFRLTVRTHMVLSAIAKLGARGADPNNREISDVAGITDQGQISRLLARLEGHGLLTNSGGQTQGVPNAWRLTPKGMEIVSLSSDRGALPSATKEEETCP